MKKVEEQQGKGIYKAVLWTAVGGFALSAFATVLMILFTDFHNNEQSKLFTNVVFIMWQTIWFGALSVMFADRYDKNPLTLAKAVSLAGIVFAVASLLVGIGQALDIYATSDLGERIKTILAIFLYSSIFAEVMLLISRPIPSVVLARNITVVMIGVFDVIAAGLIAVNYASTDEMMVRLIAVFIVVALVGVVITCILNSMHKEQLAQFDDNANGPKFVAATAAKPVNHQGRKSVAAMKEELEEDVVELVDDAEDEA